MALQEGIQQERSIQSDESMNVIEVKYPRHIRECSPMMVTKWLHMAPLWQEAQQNLSGMLDFHVQVVSVFTGLKVNEIKRAAVDDVVRLSYRLLNMISDHQMVDPTGRVVIDGQAYVYEKDFSKISTGQMIDMKLIERVPEEPHRALAICYVEEGMEYCQKDDRGVVLNPNEKREALFKERFPGDEFLNFFGFFLRESESRRNAILALQVVRMEAQRMKIMKAVQQTASGLPGQESSSGWLRSLAGLLTRLRGSRT
jgi:hypothetical protein